MHIYVCSALCKFLCVYPADVKEPGRPIFACIYPTAQKRNDWAGMVYMCVYNRIMEGKGGRLLCVAHIAKGGLFIYLLLLLLLLMGRPWAFDRRVSNPFETTGTAPALTCWITFSFRLNIFLSPFLLYPFFPFSFFFLYPFHVHIHHSADETGRGGYYRIERGFFSFFSPSSYTQEY
jgi:hypothetical protein